MTLGANPSIKEFFKIRKNKEPVFRDGGEERFYILKDHNLKQVLVQERELLKIIASFKNYFYPNLNPYEGWFGAKNGGRLEAFLNGLSASFYDNAGYTYGAVHIDLMPFTTKSKFSKLDKYGYLSRDIFRDGWASEFIEELLHFLNPSIMIVFGKRNIKYFNDYVDNSIKFDESYNDVKYCITNYGINHSIPLIGLEVNLGNPIVKRAGLSRDELFKLARTIENRLCLRRRARSKYQLSRA